MPFVGGGGSPQGSLRWIAQLDVTQFKQGTASLKTEITGVGQVAKQASTTGIAPLNQAFTPLGANMQKTTQGMTQVQKSTVTMNSAFTAGVAPIQNSGNAMNQLVTTQGKLISSSNQAGSTFGKVGNAMKNNLAAVGLLSGGIAGLDDQFLALHKSQVAADRASLMLDKTHQKIAKTQEALNDMVLAGKQNTNDYALKQKDLTLAQEQAAIMEDRLTVAQENLSEATEDFWTGIIPNALFIGGSAAQLLKEMGLKMDVLKTAAISLKNNFQGLNGVFMGLGGAAAAAAVGIGVVLIPNLFELADIIAEMSKPGADMEALSARIEDFKAKISNTDPISKFLFEFTKIKDVAVNVGAELDRQNIAKKLQENVIGSDVFKTLPTDAQAKIQKLVKFIQDAVANPNNWTRYKKDIAGRLSIDEKASKEFSKTSGDRIKAAMDEIGVIIHDAAAELPQEVADAVLKGTPIAAGDMSKAMDGLVALMDNSFADSMSKRSEARQDAINKWASEQLLPTNFDPRKLRSLIEGRDALMSELFNFPTETRAPSKITEGLQSTIENGIKEVEVDKATKPLIDQMGSDFATGIPKDVSPLMREGIEKALAAAGKDIGTAPVAAMTTGVARAIGETFAKTDPLGSAMSKLFENITGGLRDSKLKEQLKTNFDQTLGQFPESIKEMKDKAVEAWKDFAADFNKRAGLRDMFDFKIEQSKVTKDWFKDIFDKSQRGEIKADLKFQVENESINQAIKDISAGLLKAGEGGQFELRFEYDQDEATDTAKDIKKKLDDQLEEQFKKTGTQDPFQKALSDKIKESLKDGLTKSEWQEILETMSQSDTPEITVGIDPVSIELMGTTVAEKIGDVLLKAKIIEVGDDTGLVNAAGGFNAAEGNIDFAARNGGGGGNTKYAGTVNLKGLITPVFAEAPDPNNPFYDPNAHPKDDGIQFDPTFGKDKNKDKTGGTDFSSMFNAVITAAQKAQTAIANLANQGSNSMSILAKNAGVHTKSMNTYLNTTIPVAAQHSQTGLANLANEGSNSMSLLAKASSKNVNGIVNNLNKGYESAGHLQEGLANLANEGSDSLAELAKASSKAMNGLINNVEAGKEAVSELQSEINSLKSKTVTLTTKKRTIVKEGGVFSFAEGGLVSAAGGNITTSSGPTLFLYGDNPGGHETLAFIPNNNPWPTISELFGMFGNGNPGGSINPASAPGFQSAPINVNLTNVIYDYEINRRYSMRQGANQGRYG